MNISINDVFKYFMSIDNIEHDDQLNQVEYNNAIKTNSIFSSILTENMNFEQYCTTFVNTYRDLIDNGNANQGKNLPYKMENMADVQGWTWEAITRVLTKKLLKIFQKKIYRRVGILTRFLNWVKTQE